MPAKPILKIFVHASGSYIAAQEIERKDGTSIKVKYPAFVHSTPNAVGFKFEAFQFVIDEFTFFIGSLLGENAMPEIMKPFYDKYVAERIKENKKMP